MRSTMKSPTVWLIVALPLYFCRSLTLDVRVESLVLHGVITSVPGGTTTSGPGLRQVGAFLRLRLLRRRRRLDLLGLGIRSLSRFSCPPCRRDRKTWSRSLLASDR